MILQSTLLPYVAVGGVKPDLLLVLAVLVGLVFGTRSGLLAGLVAGLLKDLFLGKYLGLFTFTCVMAGYLAGLFQTKVFKGNLLVPVGVVTLVTLLHGFLVFGLLRTAGLPLSGIAVLWRILIPEVTYNVLLVPLIYPSVYRYALAGRKGPVLTEGE